MNFKAHLSKSKRAKLKRLAQGKTLPDSKLKKDCTSPKLAYITAQAPFGRGEAFILDEMLAIKEAGAELLVIPRNPTKEVFHEKGLCLLGNAIWLPLINARMILCFIASLFKKPYSLKTLRAIVCESRGLSILIKNLSVVPKGYYIANTLRKHNIDHIHAHWGTTTATMAYIASELTSIPWSLTLHRWDIEEDNLLALKAKSARFLRTISNIGRARLSQIIGKELIDKCHVIHMGVDVASPLSKLPASSVNSGGSNRPFVIICPANLLPVKGHRYLIEACRILKERGRIFICWLFGDGPLLQELQQQVDVKRLNDVVEFKGQWPHESLLDLYREQMVDCMVLPSINTDTGENEGIPVSLMEAMAAGVAVVSTTTGGIPELITDGTGILVAEKDARALAKALETLMNDDLSRKEMGRYGQQRVEKEFNVKTVARNLISLMIV